MRRREKKGDWKKTEKKGVDNGTRREKQRGEGGGGGSFAKKTITKKIEDV